jgi:alkanesulfonate monooxygenase SsuD/methylene tetrahydromethanopterin reductase-like flavin-dependent oxidoreductase (luciferase family)
LKIGVVLPQLGPAATRENVLQTAKIAENEGIDSLWVGERLLWPLNPQTPFPGSSDGSLSVEQQIMLDPLETLTYIAAKTNKIILGTSVIDMLFHNSHNTFKKVCHTGYSIRRENCSWLGYRLVQG